MREVTFQKKNSIRWKEIEESLENGSRLPADKLGELYILLNDDLSYAQTYYPSSKTERYLNRLLMEVHQSIYKNKKYDSKSIFRFWTEELPLLVYKHRKSMWTATLIFVLSVAIGVISTSIDPDFPRLILGDAYVNGTLDNINNGKPLDIYAQSREDIMFLGITANNIRVSFIMFGAGITATLGTVFALFQNGVMLGSFQYFFFQKGFLELSLLTIWVHGVLEISAIVIAGGAGMALGNSWLYPGTYSRIESLKKGAIESSKIVAGLIPIFIIAGFLEGFVTRHSQVNPIVALVLIISSLIFVSFYFIYYPYKLYHGNRTKI